MPFDTFKPELVAAEFVVNARKNLVAAQICNLQIAVGLKEMGTKISINTMGDPSSVATSETVPMTYQEVDTTENELEITLDQTVAVGIRDNDKIQIQGNALTVEQAIGRSMFYALEDDIDQLVMGLYTQATIDNYETGTTSWQWGSTPTAAELASYFSSVHKDMDDANMKARNRFQVLPNIAIQGVRQAYATVETNAGDAARVSGVPTMRVQDFAIFQSPNVVEDSSVLHGIGGIMPTEQDPVPGVMALAIQIDPTEIEKLRLEGFWKDGLRLRATAGAVVYKPERTVDINLNSNLLA